MLALFLTVVMNYRGYFPPTFLCFGGKFISVSCLLIVPFHTFQHDIYLFILIMVPLFLSLADMEETKYECSILFWN